MSEQPFTTIGDEALEARIVAWVLGEASAFEIAELERLCEERPELLIFQRRMKALHGLIQEAETPQPDANWKLPPAKRASIKQILDEAGTVRLESPKEARIRHSARRAILSIAACVVLAFVVFYWVGTNWVIQTAHMPEKKVDFLPGGGQAGAGEAYRARVVAKEQGPPMPKASRRVFAEGADSQVAIPDSGENFGEMSALSSLGQEMTGGLGGSGGVPPQKKKNQELSPAEDAPALEFSARESEALRAQASPKPSASPAAPPPSAVTPPGGAAGSAMPADSASDSGLAMNERSRFKSESEGLGGSGSGGGFAGGKDALKEADIAFNREERIGNKLAEGDKSPASETGYTSEYLFRGRDLSDENKSIDAKGASSVSNTFTDDTTIASGTLKIEGRNKKEESTADEAVAEAQQLRKSGKYEEARSTLEGALAQAPGNQQIDKELAYLDDPIRTNPALTYEHTKAVDQVRRNLYKAEGNYNLGKYDDAKREYEDVLRTDPHNSAARRGMEKLAQAKSDYYKAAYDHTRSELLTEVDKAWELEVPEKPKEFDGVVNYGSPVAADDVRAQLLADVDKAWEMNDRDEEAKSSSFLAQREMVRRQSSMAEADRLLNDARSSYAAGDYQKAYESYEQSLNLIPDVPGNPGIQERRNFLRKSLGDAAVALSMAAKKVGQHESAKQWRDKARAWDPSNPQASEELAVEVSAEIPASEEPYSTFSLNISDTSFRIAQAALAKGERPDPAGIKVEQFYNAVNYGDPAPAVGEPVACFIEQSAHPVIPGRNLVRVALKTAAAGRSAAQPLRLTLLVDQSGSMSRADRREAMDAAMRSLGTLLTEKDLVTVIGFSRKPRLLAVGMKGSEVAPRLADLVNQTSSEGGTNLELAIKLAEEKSLSHKLAGAQNRIVLFTDGAANLGDADPQRLAAKVEQLRQQGIAFDIAGIAADDLNDELLAELARKGNGRYSVVGKGEEQDFAKQLAGAFRPAAENVKVQVHFNPERVARYKLIGFEKDRLKTEDFRNDAVDAAELAAEEAGVAIYQIEPIADGRGEIGEVSVRFRDTSSGDMVERMWTMTHNPASPAIDRAAPPMQLAVLALLAGEKLKGGPLADAIDFKQFADSQATVKQAFTQDTRIADMLRMIDALK